MGMPKSLFGQDQEKVNRSTFQKERYIATILVEATIIETFSCYKDFEDLDSNKVVEIKSLLKMPQDEEIKFFSGLHFLVRTEDQEFAIIPSPKSEEELRPLYGSDGNLKGLKLTIKTVNKDLYNISKKEVSFRSSESLYIEDNDRHLPINIGSFYGSSINNTSKINAFKTNIKSKGGIYYE